MQPDDVTYDVYLHCSSDNENISLWFQTPMPLTVLKIKFLFLNHILILQEDFLRNLNFLVFLCWDLVLHGIVLILLLFFLRVFIEEFFIALSGKTLQKEEKFSIYIFSFPYKNVNKNLIQARRSIQNPAKYLNRIFLWK